MRILWRFQEDSEQVERTNSHMQLLNSSANEAEGAMILKLSRPVHSKLQPFLLEDGQVISLQHVLTRLCYNRHHFRRTGRVCSRERCTKKDSPSYIQSPYRSRFDGDIIGTYQKNQAQLVSSGFFQPSNIYTIYVEAGSSM